MKARFLGQSITLLLITLAFGLLLAGVSGSDQRSALTSWLQRTGAAPQRLMAEPADEDAPQPPALDPSYDKPIAEGGVPVANPVFSQQPAPAVKAFSVSSTPTIQIWYGNNQSFGQHGTPQRWANILGNVQDSSGIASLVYSLNNGPAAALSLGPDTRRLAEVGDFTIELDTLALNAGANQVVITATNNLALHAVATVQVNYQPANVWPLPYTANWASTSNIQSIAQVVDGRWAIQSGVLRPQVFAYDRLVALGDKTWTDYEVTVPVTVHSIDAGGFGSSGGPGVGIITRWAGHFQALDEQPRVGWQALGALGWFRWSRTGGVVSVGLVMNGYGNKELAKREDLGIDFGVNYIFKMRVESNLAGGPTYSFKAWPAAGAEPDEWDMQAVGLDTGPATGSVVLVAHHVDASFGNVTVTPLSSERHTLTVNVSGNGSVERIPNLPDYPHGQYVQLKATGNAGQMLGAWGGGLSGSANPGAITLTDDALVTATFVPSVALVSDDFNRCALGAAPWTFINPLGDANLTFNGTHATIAIPGGVNHNLGAGIYNAPRLMQPSPSGNFEIEARFDATLTTTEHAHGILVEMDADNFLRFDFRWVGVKSRIAVTRVQAGVASNLKETANELPDQPRYMRVRRVGTQWTQLYSYDGVNWIFNRQFNQPSGFVVNNVGVFVANTGGAAAPAHTAGVDYFFTNVDPIVPEDGDTLRPGVSVVGGGAISLNPNKTHYSCGEMVNVSAVAASGWSFANWAGSLTGIDNPAQLTIAGNQAITAHFVQNPVELDVSVSGQGSVVLDPLKDAYQIGETVQLEAVPADGWLFDEWSGALTGDANPAQLVMDADKSVTAHFVQAPATETPTPTATATATEPAPDDTPTPTHTPTATATQPAPDDTPTHTPTATPTPTATNGAPPDDTPTHTPTPTPTATEPASGEETPTPTPTATEPATGEETPTATPTPTATLPATTLLLEATTGGQIVADPPGPYTPGQIVTLTAIPDEGFQFVEWEISETVMGAADDQTSPTIQVTIPDTRRYRAIFAPIATGGDDHQIYLPVVGNP